jgi:hypothetical protein
MRLSSRDLHALVHSFSANEKMLFKRFNASAKKDAAYLVLFDVLVSRKEYNEEKLQKILKKKNIRVHLQSLKGYLYDQLMLFLRNNTTETQAAKMRRMTAEAEILLARGLKKNSFELFKEQIELSRPLVNPLREISAIDNVLGFAQKIADPNLLNEYEEIMVERLRIFLNLLEVQKGFRVLATFFTNNNPIRNQQVLSELNKIGKMKIMQRESDMLSPLAHIFFYNFHVFIHYMRGDFDQAYSLAKTRYAYILQHSDELKSVDSYLMNTMELLVSCAIKLHRYQNAVEHFTQLKAICEKSNTMRAQLQVHICFAQINAAYQWPEATVEKRERCMDFLRKNIEFSPAIGIGMMDLAYACFREKEYNNALTLLDLVISDKYAFHQSVLQTEARMLGILTHYELKNYLLIEYLVTNTKRYLRHEHKLYPLENAVMNGIRHLPEKINEEDMRKALLKLKNNLQEIRKNKFERNAMSTFDFAGWIEAKLS